jgi:intracellular sulfur oxidation DsrE/DsrF family protein
MSTTPSDKAALDGVSEGKVVWDVNADDPMKLARQLKVITRTYADLLAEGVTPVMVFAFRGPSTTFITRDTSAFADEKRVAVEEIQAALKQLAQKPGVSLEVCAIASSRMGVAPESLLDETPLVANTFCSLIGYQAKGYALIPVY